MVSSQPEDLRDRADYERIAQAIGFMRQHQFSAPDLATVAQHVHLSEFHFQRLFTQWAGISPKRFSQYLTIEYAKSRIAQARSVLDLTSEVGLSSPGRLHDLFVTLEALSPGEFRMQGAGLKIQYGIHPTPFGQALIACTDRGICDLHFLRIDEVEKSKQTLQTKWAKADLIADQAITQRLIDRIFESMDDQPVALLVKGTNFQIQVWRALLKIPFGEITTYQNLAAAIGCPTAARAVGNAIGCNAIGYLIPCHRVIRESGELGGYRWGQERKLSILGWEASRRSCS